MTLRGTDTKLGEAGYCPECKQDIPAGPDLCLGERPGIREACCGHGSHALAYVTYTDGRSIHGTAARAALGLTTWPEHHAH